MEGSKDRRTSKPPNPAQGAIEDKPTCGDYLLMDVIGKGAFGVVYRAVNRHRGNWVAIKQVKLNKKKKSQLSSLMMEIDLLKSLQHKNIVHYIDHICTDSELSIIMEYVENGSLESLLRKHGKFPESLVAAYIAQVVIGLHFLHDQGVIHRDIKGANILITSAGCAKLADFGVSTKLSDISNPEDSFAGTPYWMAPEIIQMSGATTACDIWSVGCTVIELLTGSPPYGNLPPAASLYRIVQDDHPPLPEGITPGLRELLLLCFQKDVSRRITADKILRHPWLGYRAPTELSTSKVERQIEEYRSRLDARPAGAPAQPAAPGTIDKRLLRKEPVGSVSLVWPDESSSEEEYQTIEKLPKKPTAGGPGDDSLSNLRAAVDDLSISGLRNGSTSTPTPSAKKEPVKAESDEEESWDTDDVAPVKLQLPGSKAEPKKTPPAKAPSKPAKSGKESSSDEESWDDVDVAPVKLQLPGDKQQAKKETPAKKPAKETNGDSDSDSGEEVLLSSGHRIVIHGSDTVMIRNLQTGEAPRQETPPLKPKSRHSLNAQPKKADTPKAPKKTPVAPLKLKKLTEDSIGSLTIEDSDSEEEAGRDLDTVDLSVMNNNKMKDWQESSDEDFGEDIELGGTLELKERAAYDSPSSSEDPFDDIFEYGSEATDDILKLQKLEDLKRQVTGWLDLLTAEVDDAARLDACTKLITTFKDQEDIQPFLINNRTVIVVLRLLEESDGKKDRPLILSLLQFSNEMLTSSSNSKQSIQSFCLLGGIPAITRFASAHQPKNIRLEVARFVNRITRSHPSVLRMYIACGGLSVLTVLLEPNYKSFHELVQLAIDSIWNIFHLQGLPKNDFCHLFSKAGLLERLAITLSNIFHDPTAEDMLRKTSDIMFYFSQASLDTGVQKNMCTPQVLQPIREALEDRIRPAYHLLWLLHTVKNLSINISVRPLLESNGFIPVLLRFLERRTEFTEEEKGNASYTDERENVTIAKLHNQVMNIMLNLCQMDTKNLEKVAMAGIIPSLIYFIEEGPIHILKELSLKLFLPLPLCSAAVRDLLWETESFPVYMRLLGDRDWFVDALQSIDNWRKLQPHEMDRKLEAEGVEHLADVFSFHGKPGFVKSLEPLLTIVQDSGPLCKALVRQGVIGDLLDGLKDPNPHVQTNLLKILHSMLFALKEQQAATLVKEHEMRKVIENVYASTTRVLVKNICQRLLALPAFHAK